MNEDVCIRTYNDSSHGKEHKGVLPEERQNVLFGDLLHLPLGLHGADVNPFPDALHPADLDADRSFSSLKA